MVQHILYYLLTGFCVTLISIRYYRKDGQSKDKYELYFATIGPLIWPLLVIKAIIDFTKSTL